ncbi:DUF6491 family protein [Brevundimonas sp.]|uniref:DUF6491 family protein n=1 Tax=Brevundimonas sp. TaxID=1871086 RepID=UPI0025E8D811|nr:DUF6491 family protein [Brevundimonas sp.]
MRTPLALGALFLATACAPTAMDGPRQPRECFFASEVDSFASSENRVVYVRTSRDEVFRLDTFSCGNVDWSQSIGIRPTGGGSSVCSGFDAELIVPDIGRGTTTCPVTGVRRLTDAEVAALNPRDLP